MRARSEQFQDRGSDWKVKIRVDGTAAFDNFDRIGCGVGADSCVSSSLPERHVARSLCSLASEAFNWDDAYVVRRLALRPVAFRAVCKERHR